VRNSKSEDLDPERSENPNVEMAENSKGMD